MREEGSSDYRSSAKGPVTLRRPLQLLYPLEMCTQGEAASAAVADVASIMDVSYTSIEPKVREQREASRLGAEKKSNVA